MQLADRIASLPASETIAMAQKARDMKAQGIDIISLSLGEPDFDTPVAIQQAAIHAINERYFHYPPIAGFPELKQAIIRKFDRENNLKFTAEEIVVSTGAKQSIANVIFSLINPGDEVILPAPYWVSYPLMVQLAGGVCRFITAPSEQHFKFTPMQLQAAITDKTKLIIYSSPCNPTGAVYHHDELALIADIIAKHPQIIAISDEIYEHINFIGSHYSLASFAQIREQVVTVNGVSKAYAMTGWRLGYMAAPKWLADACTKVQSQFTSASSAISQRAAIEALNTQAPAAKQMCQTYLNRRNLLIEALSEMKELKISIPDGAFYLFPNIKAFFGRCSAAGKRINDSNDLCEYLLESAHVACVSGEAFGDPECIRLSYATSDELLTEAAKRIKLALGELA